MSFHERIKYLREKHGYKQIDIAKKIGVKNNTLSSYESGVRQPDYEILIKLADLYEVSAEYLLRGSDAINPNENNLFFYDTEGLNDEEIADIKRHIEYVKWKASQDKINE